MISRDPFYSSWRRVILAAVIICGQHLALQSLSAQTITTVVGNNINDNRPATQTPLVRPLGLAFDAAGNLVIADRGSFLVRRVSAASGVTTILAGGGNIYDDAIPVAGRSVVLDYPHSVAADSDGSIYFSEFNSLRVRKITPDGLVTTLAGTGYYGYSGDGGRATLAELTGPTGLAVDRTRRLLYLADSDSSVVRSVNLSTGIIQTVAGNGQEGSTGDGGPATQARLNYPWGLALDAAGNLYISDLEERMVRRVSTAGIITTFVPATAGLAGPTSLAFDPAGRLHIVDTYNETVVRASADGAVTIIAGGGDGGALPLENVSARSEYLYDPIGLAIDSAGNLYISEAGWSLVRRVDAATGTIRTFAGTLDVLDGGPAVSAPLAVPVSVAFSPLGDLYITDRDHLRIRKVTPNGIISTVVGNGSFGFAQDGALAASNGSAFPLWLSVDPQGRNLYYTEAFSMVRKLDLTTGRLTTVAGQFFEFDYTGDGGPATAAKLNFPLQAVADSAGNVYISDRDNHCVRRVSPAGIISRFAGTCTVEGYSGDGGIATQAQMSNPTGLAFDASGNLLIAEYGNGVVRRVNVTTGIITRVAGIARSFDYSGDLGPPLQAKMSGPTGLAVDRTGNILIVDEDYSVIRIIRGNIIDTLAGSGYSGFFGDGGEAKFAWLNFPQGIAVDPAGNVLVADAQNHRVRRINLGSVAPATLSVSPLSLTFEAAQGSTAPAAQTVNIRNSGSGSLLWTAAAATVPAGTWLQISATSGSAPASLQVSVNPAGLTAGSYQGTVTIRSTQVSNSPQVVNVTLRITSAAPATLEISSQFFDFEAVQGGAAPSAQILSIRNSGSGALSWNAAAITSRGGPWLTLSPNSGVAQGGAAGGNVVLSVDPSGLSTGVYLGIVTVIGAGASRTAVVSLLVTEAATQIQVSPKTFLFIAVQGSNSVPPQSFRILNSGRGEMPWQVLQQSSWMRVTPSTGTSDAARPATSPSVNLAVDPTGLEPGVHGGLLVVQSPGARNNPQLATVLLRILPRGAPPVASVDPVGLTLVGDTGGAQQSKEVSLQTTGGEPLSFRVGVLTQEGSGWLSASPGSGTLLTSSERTALRVQATPGTLPAGVYRGAITLSFGDGTVREIAVAFVLRGSTAVAAASAGKQTSHTCAPDRQVMTSTRLSNSFSVPTGYPAALIVAITDNCGGPVANSTVAATFTNGNPPIVLQNLRDGSYSATWVPEPPTGTFTPAVQVSMNALNPSLPVATLQFSGEMRLDNTVPVITDNGVVNAASFTALRPVSPGGIVTIFGKNLAEAGSCFGGNCPVELPLPVTLGGASVKIGGFDAPLFYAGPGQINAQVPAQLTGLSSADVVVAARGIVSSARSVQIDAAQPGIFMAGGTQGAVLNQDFSANSAANPADRGSVLQIYATGLGPTNPAVATGEIGPTSPPFATVVNSVTVSLGGVNAPVEFQALAPGFVGLYQINIRVPASVAPGSAVSLKITQNGVESNPVTVAIR